MQFESYTEVRRGNSEVHRDFCLCQLRLAVYQQFESYTEVRRGNTEVRRDFC